MLVVDSSFRTLAMEPEQPIGIDSWDRILQGEAPQHHDLKQAEAMIENFSARNLTGLQTVPYTEPDGRPVRRMVGPVVAPDDGRNCGGLEIIELKHPFAPEDEVLAQRLLELLQHYLVHAAPTAWRAAPEERFLQELLFCEPAQQSAMQKKLHRFPALEAPPPGRRSVPASLVWVPGCAGLMMAGDVILTLAGCKKEKEGGSQ